MTFTTIQSLLCLLLLGSVACAQHCSHTIHFRSKKGRRAVADDLRHDGGNEAGLGLTRDCLESLPELQLNSGYSDAVYIKCKKIELLSDVCTISCSSVIVIELMSYTADECELVASKAVEAVGLIGVRLAQSCELCVAQLVELLSSDCDRVISEALVAISKISLSSTDIAGKIVPYLPRSVLHVRQQVGRAALIWILGEFGQDMEDAPCMLKEVINNLPNESSSVKLQLLSSVTKMFFKRAPESQEMLGRLLEHCIKEVSNVDVRDRALLYYRLLQLDIHKAMRVVGHGPVLPRTYAISSQHQTSFYEFNSLAVMYGAPCASFISLECPYSQAYGPCSRENALHWDLQTVKAKSLEDESSPVHVNSTDLMNELSCRKKDLTPSILLDPSPKLSASEFEKMWLRMHPVKDLKVHLSRVPSCKELMKLLHSQLIKTMATSSDDQPIVKMFFYAQHVSTRHFFLVEVSIAVANGLLMFTLKCENRKQASSFMTHFFQTLGLSKQLPRLQWRVCEDVPTAVKKMKGVFFEQNLYLGGGFTLSSKADAIVYSYNPKLDMWKLLPPSPLKWFSMAVFGDQLVLVGGKETDRASTDYSNKLASWNKTDMRWTFSLPPMLKRRSSPIVVSHDGSLIVAGGNKGVLDYSVEVFCSGSQQWVHAPQMPLSCSSSPNTIVNGSWYFFRETDNTVICTTLSSFVRSAIDGAEIVKESGLESGYNSLSCSQDSQCTVATSQSQPFEWQSYCFLPFTPTQISTIKGCLIAFSVQQSSNGHLAAFGYIPENNSWTHLGNLPAQCSNASFIALPSGELFVVGGDTFGSSSSQYTCSSRVFCVSIVNPS